MVFVSLTFFKLLGFTFLFKEAMTMMVMVVMMMFMDFTWFLGFLLLLWNPFFLLLCLLFFMFAIFLGMTAFFLIRFLTVTSRFRALSSFVSIYILYRFSNCMTRLFPHLFRNWSDLTITTLLYLRIWINYCWLFLYAFSFTVCYSVITGSIAMFSSHLFRNWSNLIATFGYCLITFLLLGMFITFVIRTITAFRVRFLFGLLSSFVLNKTFLFQISYWDLGLLDLFC